MVHPSWLLTFNHGINGSLKATQHAESSDLKVVGYYQACERLDDTSLAPVGERVAGKIKAGFEDAIAFVVRGFVPLTHWSLVLTVYLLDRLMGRSLGRVNPLWWYVFSHL